MQSEARYIQLIQEQIQKLDAPGFELSAWKTYTKIVLERIFGPFDNKIKQIDTLKTDFSSWSLRDTSGKRSSMDICKDEAKQILQAAISEIEDFGIETASEPRGNENLIENEIFIEELRSSELKKAKDILQGNLNTDEKQNELTQFLSGIDKEILAGIIARLLLSK